MPEMRVLEPLSDGDLVESYFRIVERMPWREQVCKLCQHPRHATPCPEASDDDETEKCSCGWVQR